MQFANPVIKTHSGKISIKKSVDCVIIPRKKQKKKPLKKSEACGNGRDRTADTRIFSPVLYRLSYITVLKCSAKIEFL